MSRAMTALLFTLARPAPVQSRQQPEQHIEPDSQSFGGNNAAFKPHDQAQQVPLLQQVPDSSTVYLGEACIFHVTLSNKGHNAIAAITVKVECSIEGGSSSVLHDNSSQPLQQLTIQGFHNMVVQTDIREQGLITLVASAVYTDHMGDRKYHVQFFKLRSTSPVTVRTRVRCLSHVLQLSSHSSQQNSSQQDSSQQHSSSDSVDAQATCFLEVGVENVIQSALILHALKLLPAAGIHPIQLQPPVNKRQQEHQQQQQHDSWPGRMHGQDAAARQQQQGQQLQEQQQQKDNLQQHWHGSKRALSQELNDTQQLHDTLERPAGADFSSLGKLPKLPNDWHYLQQQQAQQQQQLSVQPDGAVIIQPGGSYNHLWRVEQPAGGLAAAAAASAGSVSSASTPPSSSSTSSASLGRLELHWSSADGKTGRLVTQPLSGPVPASGREVLMQLSQLLPAAAATGSSTGSCSSSAVMMSQAAPFVHPLALAEPVRATFTLTAAAAPQLGHPSGPLLVLCTELPPTSGASVGATTTPVAKPACAAASAASSQKPCGVVVVGKRSRRISKLLPGRSLDVSFELLAVRAGWVRLPTFVLVNEADGRLLDSIHDVQVLVV